MSIPVPTIYTSTYDPAQICGQKSGLWVLILSAIPFLILYIPSSSGS